MKKRKKKRQIYMSFGFAQLMTRNWRNYKILQPVTYNDLLIYSVYLIPVFIYLFIFFAYT